MAGVTQGLPTLAPLETRNCFALEVALVLWLLSSERLSFNISSLVGNFCLAYHFFCLLGSVQSSAFGCAAEFLFGIETGFKLKLSLVIFLMVSCRLLYRCCLFFLLFLEFRPAYASLLYWRELMYAYFSMYVMNTGHHILTLYASVKLLP